MNLCSICGGVHRSEDKPCPQTFSVSLDEFMAPMPVVRRQWQSYLKWGKQGPPHGALVTSIVNGFGNAEGGVVMRVTGPVDDSKYIWLRALQIQRCGYTPSEPSRSGCAYEAWWTKIVEADEEERASRDYWPEAPDTWQLVKK